MNEHEKRKAIIELEAQEIASKVTENGGFHIAMRNSRIPKDDKRPKSLDLCLRNKYGIMVKQYEENKFIFFPASLDEEHQKEIKEKAKKMLEEMRKKNEKQLDKLTAMMVECFDIPS